MTVKEVLRRATIAPLDAEFLLAHVLERNRAWLLAHAEERVTPEQKRSLAKLLKRRKNHAPIAYLIGEKEFYGRKFFVDHRVMIPRPSTETLVDEIKRLIERGFNVETSRTTSADTGIVIISRLFRRKVPISNPSRRTRLGGGRSRSRRPEPLTIVDVGTGCGCIGITLALEIPDVHIICTDISEEALEVAQKNAKRHNVFDPCTSHPPGSGTERSRITFQKVDHISGQLSTFNFQLSTFLVVSNPPYIPNGERDALPPDVLDFEPHEALFAGPDGMDVLMPLVKQCQTHPLCMGYVLEMREEQAKKLMS